jgi:hypothetical protein
MAKRVEAWRVAMTILMVVLLTLVALVALALAVLALLVREKVPYPTEDQFRPPPE